MQRVIFDEGNSHHCAFFEAITLHVNEVFQLVLVEHPEIEVRMRGVLDVWPKAGVHFVFEQLVLGWNVIITLKGEFFHDQ